MVEAAKNTDVNLIYFPGQALQSPHNYEDQANTIFNLVSNQSVDRLIIWAGALEWYVGSKGMADFCQQFAPRPYATTDFKHPHIQCH